MKSRSAGVNMRRWRAARRSAPPLGCPPHLSAGALELEHLLAELVDALEILVHRREADVGDVVHLLQLGHHHLADRARGDFPLAPREELLLDAVDRAVDVLRRHRALVQRPREAGADLLTVVRGAIAVRLHHCRHRQLDPLVGSETLVAGFALAPPADALAVLRHAGVDDGGVFVLAERTPHRVGYAAFSTGASARAASG